jgi:plastocyanin
MLHPVIVANRKSKVPDAFYVPNPIRVRAGQTVTWTNDDNDLHDVTADDGTFSSGPMAYRTTWRLRLTRPGTYRYFCTLHPDMHGTLIVLKG